MVFNLLGEDISDFLKYLDNLNLRVYYIDEDSRSRQPVSKDWLLDFREK